MNVAVAATGDAGRAAHVLREDALGLHPTHQMRGEVAVQHAQVVLRRERERGARRNRLLATTVIERAGHLPLAIKVQRTLLDAAHEQHVAQQLHAVRDAERA